MPRRSWPNTRRLSITRLGSSENHPNGSLDAIEGITSPCGRVLGKMGHGERAGSLVAKNIPGNKHLPVFAAGVAYFSR